MSIGRTGLRDVWLGMQHAEYVITLELGKLKSEIEGLRTTIEKDQSYLGRLQETHKEKTQWLTEIERCREEIDARYKELEEL